MISTGPEEMQVERSLPHGHVAASLGMLRRIALDRLILSTAKDAASRRHCDLVVAMIVAPSWALSARWMELLAATERELARIQAQVRRRHSPLRSAAEIGLAVGGVVNSRKMAKHLAIEIRDGHFAFQRRIEQIEAEARLDGVYVIRTSVPVEHLDANEAVQAYKDLSRVERAFRSMKTVDLDIRPIRHWTAPRVRAHVFLCMLALT